MLTKQIHGTANSHASIQTDHGQEGMRHPANQAELTPCWLPGCFKTWKWNTGQPVCYTYFFIKCYRNSALIVKWSDRITPVGSLSLDLVQYTKNEHIKLPRKLDFPMHYKMIEDSIASWYACSLPQWSPSERYFPSMIKTLYAGKLVPSWRFSLHRKHGEKTMTTVPTAYNTPLWIMQPCKCSLQFAGKKRKDEDMFPFQAPHWAESTGKQTLPHLSRQWCNL